MSHHTVDRCYLRRPYSVTLAVDPIAMVCQAWNGKNSTKRLITCHIRHGWITFNGFSQSHNNNKSLLNVCQLIIGHEKTMASLCVLAGLIHYQFHCVCRCHFPWSGSTSELTSPFRFPINTARKTHNLFSERFTQHPVKKWKHSKRNGNQILMCGFKTWCMPWTSISAPPNVSVLNEWAVIFVFPHRTVLVLWSRIEFGSEKSSNPPKTFHCVHHASYLLLYRIAGVFKLANSIQAITIDEI